MSFWLLTVNRGQHTIGFVLEWAFYLDILPEKINQAWAGLLLGFGGHIIDLEEPGIFKEYMANNSDPAVASFLSTGYEEVYYWWGWYSRVTVGAHNYGPETSVQVKATEDSGIARDEKVDILGPLSLVSYGLYLGVQFHFPVGN